LAINSVYYGLFFFAFLYSSLTDGGLAGLGVVGGVVGNKFLGCI
jgi:hypothetical protein